MSEMAELTHCAMWICRGCLDGCGSECHTPGCGFYMNRAPDIPLTSAEPLAEGSETGATILKLQAEMNEVRRLLDGAMSAAESAVSRARAQGRLEGMKEAVREVEYQHECADYESGACATAVERLEDMLAAAERELAGGGENSGE